MIPSCKVDCTPCEHGRLSFALRFVAWPPKLQKLCLIQLLEQPKAYMLFECSYANLRLQGIRKYSHLRHWNNFLLGGNLY